MKIISLPLLACLVILSAGCGKKENELSAGELSSAIGVSWWIIDIPEVREGEYLGLSFWHSGQTEADHGGAGGWPAGEAKVFIYDEDEELISYAIVGPKNSVLKGSMPNVFVDYEGISNRALVGSRVELGDILIKKSKINSTSGNTNELSSEEVGVAVTISKDKS